MKFSVDAVVIFGLAGITCTSARTTHKKVETMSMKYWLTRLAAAGFGLFAMAPANAVPVILETFVFTSDHCTGGCLTDQINRPNGNGGSVTVTDLGNGTLSFAVVLANGNQFINAGFEASFGFNLVDNPRISYSAISPAGFTIPGAFCGQSQPAECG